MEDLLIRWSRSSSAEVEWGVRSAQGELRLSRGPLSAAAAEASGRRVTVLVPSAEVLLTSVSLPRTNPQQFARAVPYALEESLAVEVEEQHFAAGLRDADGQTAVAVVSRDKMEEWLAALQAAGLEPAALVPDLLALPREPGAWSLLVEGQEALVRTGMQSGFVTETENLALTLGQPAQDGESCPPLFLQTETALPHGLPEDCTMRRPKGAGEPESPAAVLLRGYSAKSAINLLQGPYSRRAQWDKLWRHWRWPLALAAAALMLQLVLLVQDYVSLRSQSQILSRQIEQLYRTTFPAAQKIVNPRVQMEQHLTQLLGEDSTQHSGFLGLLERSGPLLAEAQGFHLKGLRYRSGQLDLEIELPDLQALDRLKNHLQQGGLQSDIKTASAQQEKVQARLTISQ